MSLFRTREFWSFDLNKLRATYQQSQGIQLDSNESDDNREANFVFALGKFHSVGNKQQVFVCADLDGFVCIVQVPKADQIHPEAREEPAGSEDGKESSSWSDRQLLAIKQLPFPVVDLKCGYFISALKQSIAVLSYDQLAIYQVKRHQEDLLSSSSVNAYRQDNDGQSTANLNENLLSHELLEHHRLDLLPNQLAANLTILNYHRVATTNSRSSQDTGGGDHVNINASPSGAAKHKHKNTHSNHAFNLLPQRDTIIVQYTNQLVFSLLDHKKVVAHYELPSSNHEFPTNESNQPQEARLQQLAQFLGYMPMGFLLERAASYLCLSTSEYKVYCLNVAKLVALAKQDVMKRVALTLLSEDRTNPPKLKSALAYDNEDAKKGRANHLVRLDLDTLAEWQVELACAPFQMETVHRRLRNSTGANNLSSQLLIASRYNLDLFSNKGQHLWSQRFESPLIHLHAYSLDQLAETKAGEDKKVSDDYCDRLMSLICSDNLSNDKCDLSVLEDNRLCWSSLLDTRPIQLQRTNLCKMSGVLTALDVNEARLSVSYLGTNLPDLSQAAAGEMADDSDDSKDGNPLLQLGSLDLKDASEDGPEGDQVSRCSNVKLIMDARLEATNQWPDVRVDCQVSIRPETAQSHGVLQNIIAVLEFDDLIAFEPAEGNATSVNYISPNVVQIKLGSYWPDRREPIRFGGRFAMISNLSPHLTAEIQPKSLKVRILFRFNELQVGQLVQEDSFLLPLNMVAPLAHIDYSTSSLQSLDDVLANLNSYKRQPSKSSGDDDLPPYYLCDLFIREPSCEIIDLIDELVESDLVCRGFNAEAQPRLDFKVSDTKDKNITTLENVTLLAQSLDCRLRYQSSAHPSVTTATTARQSSEEYSPVVIVSLALKMPTGSHLIEGTGSDDTNHEQTLIWLHICDLSAINSVIPEELVKMHMKEWKVYQDLESPNMAADLSPFGCPIMISLESDHPMPILFVQSHLVERLKRRFSRTGQVRQLVLRPFSESDHDLLEINYQDIFKLNNFIALSSNLHDCLQVAMKRYQVDVVQEYKRLKDELQQEYCKFHVSTAASLSQAKRLYKLPDTMQTQFASLSMLTKHYYLNLNRILSQLEKLKRLDYLYSKITSSVDIILEDSESIRATWPDFERIID